MAALAACVKLGKVLLEFGACGSEEEGKGDAEADVHAMLARFEPM